MAAPNPAHLEDPFGPDPPAQPMLPVASTKKRSPEKKLREEAKTLRDRIWNNYKTLRELVAKYHGPIEKRWRGFTGEQREMFLQTAWKKTISTTVEMSSDRFPQANMVFELEKCKLEGREPSIDARQYRAHWLLPQLNIPSLVFDRSFLVLLIERAKNHPWKFSTADEERIWLTMMLSVDDAFMAEQLGIRFEGLRDTVHIVTSMPTDTDDEGRDFYGHVVSMGNTSACLAMLEDIEMGKETPEDKAKRLEERRKRKAEEKEKRKEAEKKGEEVVKTGEEEEDNDAPERLMRWTSYPDQGMFLLQAQDFLYRFLVNISRELKSGITESPPPKFPGVREELDKLTTAALRYDQIGHEHFPVEWPYRNPRDLDIEYIHDSLSAGLERWIQHLTALRTNADYFRKFVTLQYLSYQTRLQADPPGPRSGVSGDDWVATHAIWECVYDALTTVCYWKEMVTMAQEGFGGHALLNQARERSHEYNEQTLFICDWPDGDLKIEEEMKQTMAEVLMIKAGYEGEEDQAQIEDILLASQQIWEDWLQGVPRLRPSTGSKDSNQWSRKEWLLRHRNYVSKWYQDKEMGEYWEYAIHSLSPFFDTLWMTLQYLGERLHWGLWQPQLRLFLRRPTQNAANPDGYQIIGEGDYEATKMESEVRDACLEIIRLIGDVRKDCAKPLSISMLLARATRLEHVLKGYEAKKTLCKNWHPWLGRVNSDIIAVATVLEIFTTWVPEGRAVDTIWPEKKKENQGRRDNFTTVLSTIEIFLLFCDIDRNSYTRRAAAVAKDILGDGFRSGFVDPLPDSSKRQELDQLLGHFWYCIHREAVGAPEDAWLDHPYDEGSGREFSKTKTKPPRKTNYENLEPSRWLPPQRAHLKDRIRESYAWRQLIGDPKEVACPDLDVLGHKLKKQGLSSKRLEKAIEYARKFIPPETEEIEVPRTPETRSIRSKASVQSLRSTHSYDIEPATPGTRLLVPSPSRLPATPGKPSSSTEARLVRPAVDDETVPPPQPILEKLLEEQKKDQADDKEGEKADVEKKKPEKKDSPRTAKRKRKQAGKEKKRKEKEAREEQDPEVARQHRQATPPPSPTQEIPPKRKFYLRKHAHGVFEWMLRPDTSSNQAPLIPWDTVTAALRSGMNTRCVSIGGSAFRFVWDGWCEEDLDRDEDGKHIDRERYSPRDYNPTRPKSWHMPHGAKGSKMSYADYRRLGEEFKKAWDWTWDRFGLLSDLTNEERRAARLLQGQNREEEGEGNNQAAGEEEEEEEDVPAIEEEAETEEEVAT